MAQSYRFGPVEVRPAERQLLVDGRPAVLGARAFDVLLALIDGRDRVVTKDELLDRVWPGLVVEENNLQVQVSTLRKILGAHSVATIPGRGYRFTLGAQDAEGEPGAAADNHNLPAPLSSFIGREREIANLAATLGASRLTTLTSVGGTGKTRLALQVGREVLALFPDGVWLVELAPLAEAARVPQAVASVLGVKEEAGRPVIEALVRYARGRRMLLILDNCEHLVHACAELARQLLQSAPGLTILASSREPLHVAGEAQFPVAPLAVPDARRDGSLEDIAACEAVRLFVERAAAVEPSFRLDAGNAPAVAQVCRRLDGIPLAIELAAARVRSLAIDDIAARLDDCFRLLTGGDKSALPRQQTLRASLDWSHDLLSPAERVLLRRLAVFTGGCTLEAAESIGAGGEVGGDDVVDLLAHLVDKSLVSPEGAGGARYRLLETVRQYAHERLVTAVEADIARGKHLAYFLTLVENARAGLKGPEQGVWLARLDRERENLLSAHAWCDHAADGAELGLRLASATKLYWINRGLLGLGHRVALEALSRPGAGSRNTARCRALFDAGQISFYMGRYPEAQASLEESLAIAREADDKARIGAALQPLGMACVGRGDLGAARRHLEEALELARALGNQRNLAAALNARAQLDRIEGRLGEADTVYHEVLALARGLGDRESIAIGLLNLAMVAIARGDGHRARAMLLEVLAIAEEVGSIRVGQSALEVCAGLAASLGDASRAARLYGVAEAQTAATGIHRDPADEAFLAPLVAQARASLAPVAFAAAEEAGRALAYEEAIAEALTWLEGLP